MANQKTFNSKAPVLKELKTLGFTEMFDKQSQGYGIRYYYKKPDGAMNGNLPVDRAEVTVAGGKHYLSVFEGQK